MGSDGGATGQPVELSDASFDEFVGKNAVAVVDFWATWCMPCRKFAPIFAEMASAHAGKATYGKVDVDRNGATATRFGIMSIPTIVVFKGGKKVDQKSGALTADELRAMVEKHF